MAWSLTPPDGSPLHGDGEGGDDVILCKRAWPPPPQCVSPARPLASLIGQKRLIGRTALLVRQGHERQVVFGHEGARGLCVIMMRQALQRHHVIAGRQRQAHSLVGGLLWTNA